MKETRIECFRAGESSLSYCLPQVLRITCSGVLRTLICSYLDTGKKRCLKIGKSYKMKKTCVFLGSWILSPVMQGDQRHPLFLGGDGRAAQRFKQMIESLNHRTQRGHSLSEEPLLCANRPAMQCIVGLRKDTTYELASRKANTERIDGLQGFCRLHGVHPMLTHDVDQHLPALRQLKRHRNMRPPMAAILLLRTLIPASIPAQTPRRVQAPRTARIQLIPPMPVLLLALPMERTLRLQRMT